MIRMTDVAVLLAASVATGACVQTKQYADMQFTPPQGDYKLLVLRPDVTVGSLTTGGMVEPRADWTDRRAQTSSRRFELSNRVTVAKSRLSSTGTSFPVSRRRSWRTLSA